MLSVLLNKTFPSFLDRCASTSSQYWRVDCSHEECPNRYLVSPADGRQGKPQHLESWNKCGQPRQSQTVYCHIGANLYSNWWRWEGFRRGDTYIERHEDCRSKGALAWCGSVLQENKSVCTKNSKRLLRH